MTVQRINNTVIINGDKYRTIESDELRHRSSQISDQIKKIYDKNFVLVSIGHGGNEIAGYIVDHFRTIPKEKGDGWEPLVYYVVVRSYFENEQKEGLEVTQKLGKSVRKYIRDNNLDIVVVDDVSDSGKTFIDITNYLIDDVYLEEKINGLKEHMWEERIGKIEGEYDEKSICQDIEKEIDELKPEMRIPYMDRIKSAAFMKEAAKYTPDFLPEEKVQRDLWLIFPRERGETGRIILEKHSLEDGIRGMHELGYNMEEVDRICRLSVFDKEKYRDIIWKTFCGKRNGGNLK